MVPAPDKSLSISPSFEGQAQERTHEGLPSISLKFQVNATTSELSSIISLEANLNGLNTSSSTCKALWVYGCSV